MHQAECDHPVLGRLRWNGTLAWWEAQVELLPYSAISLAIDPVEEGTADPERSLAVAAEYLGWTRGAELTCRERIADDLLETYNEAWADDDPEEGPPRLTRREFIARLKLEGISLHSDGSAGWIYDPGDLFAGHGISVWVSEDRVFGEAGVFG
jgi:hypothetical protein